MYILFKDVFEPTKQRFLPGVPERWEVWRENVVIICHRGNIWIYGHVVVTKERRKQKREVLKDNIKNVLFVGLKSFGCGGITVQRHVDSVMVSPGAYHLVLPSVSLRKWCAVEGILWQDVEEHGSVFTQPVCVCGLRYITLEVSLSCLQRKIKISKRIKNGKELYTI